MFWCYCVFVGGGGVYRAARAMVEFTVDTSLDEERT